MSSLYEDDGKTLDYRKGDFMKRAFHQNREQHKLTVEISRPEGPYRPSSRQLVLQIWCDREPKSVTEIVGEGASANEVTLQQLEKRT